MVYGILQERLMTIPFGGKGQQQEVFNYSLFLVLSNRLTACAVSVLLLTYDGSYHELRPVAPAWSYLGVSASNVLATTCQYEALKHVSFSIQTLGKCGKMFPVMLWGTLMVGRRYTASDWVVALMVTTGCSLFLSTGSVHSRVADSAWHSSLYGLALMLGYLVSDGFTSSLQDRLFKRHDMTAAHQVLYTTMYSSCISVVGLVSSKQLPLAWAFVLRHPDALVYVLVLSAAATVSSIFISHTIKTSGALALATILTTRQLLSILASNLAFGHHLSGGQWTGSSMVFGALYYRGYVVRQEIVKVQYEPLQAGPPAVAAACVTITAALAGEAKRAALPPATDVENYHGASLGPLPGASTLPS
ncbi:UDP-galactose/UDP-glucose transporter 5 [Tetrabaena socialis]|uniref:UDP-galactose/UDP-glucose transporter 5 n=1 Tax=Tetrabaena socialis TaxID=47790 RepID=A0A2J8A899_9CHLO|nr:UDP-galactose/UDP-glucose transporter 5 [Tetrabaena socialis]|eukprot:PNH08754.1 UDP-galactose/UDP-glucose transporter 5 [Tetrabaena socialis]